MTKSITLFLPDEASTLQLGARLAKWLPVPAIIFLKGQLGAGKTTLTRGILRELGYVGSVKSPTYTLVESYELTDKTIFHFDLYRLQNPEELLFIGMDDYISQDSICLIEWAELAETVLPQPDLVCHLELKDQSRQVTFTAVSEQGQRMLQGLSI